MTDERDEARQGSWEIVRRGSRAPAASVFEMRRLIRRRIVFAQILLCVSFGLLAAVSYRYPDRLGSFSFVLLMGALGGSITTLRQIRSEDPRQLTDLAYDPVSSLMPILYGALMGAIAYLFFASGILSGDSGHGILATPLFPNFTDPKMGPGETLSVRQFVKMRPDGIRDASKLLVWAFIAGYSGRFVTGILGQLERTGDSTK